MHAKLSGTLWQSSHKAISFTQLTELSGLSEQELRELVENGVFVPLDKKDKQWTFTADYAVTARTVHRLRNDLDLDAHGLTAALTLLERVRLLEAEQQGIRTTQGF